MRWITVVIVSSFLYTGNGICQSLSRTIITEFGQAKVNLKSAPPASHANELSMYYYVDANELIITQGAYYGELLHGNASFFSKDGVLSSQGSFKGGLKHGKWIHWDEKGMISRIVTWKKGIKHGRYKRVYEDGSVEEGAWKKDQMHGTWTYSEKSTIIKEEQYKKGVLKYTEKEYEVKKFEEKKPEEPKENKARSKEVDTQKK